MVYVEHTLRRFPIHPKMKDECALPFGMAVCPFAQMAEVPINRTPKLQAADVPRCSECLAYINCFSGLDAIGWRCSLCGSYNEYVNQESRRYSRSAARDGLRELNDQVYEVLCPVPRGAEEEEGDGGRGAPTGPFPIPRDGRPVFIALVDTTGCAEYIELVKTALAAAVQGLPRIALVGIITLSDQVGLWDVKGECAVVRNVPIFQDGRIMAPLEDVLPLRSLLAPIELCESSISAALELLRPTPGRSRAFGASMHAVLDYLVGLKEPPRPEPHQNQRDSYRHEANVHLGAARLACFLSGAPNMGLGCTVISDSANGDLAGGDWIPTTSDVPPSEMAPVSYENSAQPLQAAPPQQMSMEASFTDPDAKGATKVDPESRKFYEQLAVVAALEGVCIDVFTVSTKFCGLACLAPLCEKTGGALYHYSVIDDAALPQDLYKRVLGPHALAGLLRVRCCPELRIKQSYGRLFPDADHEQLYHLVSCDAKESLAFDLDFTSQNGFLSDGGNKVTHPVIQFAFQYSVLVAVPEEVDADSAKEQKGSPKGSPRKGGPLMRYEMQRRMRITTVAPRLAKSHDVIFSNAQVDTVVKVLMHKVLQCQADEGTREARKLLQDWFVIMCSRFHHIVGKVPYGATPQPGQIDVMLDRCDALSPMATLTYALLRSPLLAAAQSKFSDLAAYLKLLWCGLPPAELQRVLYPLLISFQSPDDKAHERHLLSRAIFEQDERPILLLDAFHVILVMYRRNCPPEFQFPPPPDSHIRTSIHAIKQSRKISPKIKYVREGEADAALLDAYLIDEPLVGMMSDNPSDVASLGFAQWVLHIQNDVQKFISTER